MAEIEYEAVDFSGLTFSDNEKISTLKDRPNVGTPIGNGYSSSDLKLRFDAAADFLLHYLNLVMLDNGNAIKIADVYGVDTTTGVKTLADLVASITSGVLANYLLVSEGKETLAKFAEKAVTDVYLVVNKEKKELHLNPTQNGMQSIFNQSVVGLEDLRVDNYDVKGELDGNKLKLNLTDGDVKKNNGVEIPLPFADYVLGGEFTTSTGTLKITITNPKVSLNKSIEINLPTESYFKAVRYDSNSKSLMLKTDMSDEEISVPIGALVKGLLTEELAASTYVAKNDLPENVKKIVNENYTIPTNKDISNTIKKEAVTKIAGFDGVTVEERAISLSVDLNVDGIEVEFDENNEAVSFNITSFLPIKPGSLYVNNYGTGWEWEDDGNGNLIRDGGIAGTVNYETGKIELNYITQGNTYVTFKPDATCIGLSIPINTILKRITDVENSISGVEEELALLNEGGAV